ncbi:MFS transporter [Anaeromicrobium sediminis]|uniref:Major facilitator superfamily (MFS) profile domain-containing protein n=1 Tax=Anaeromicrobium sediminis TaxID=1478221 RepID=A0A267MM31_9FIRM|nr:MFS transporter [Anaeromicrobium sediminis]PAB59863.1 hypothetical protein CCE28_07870 [Anaeromicrobium sediminis]
MEFKKKSTLFLLFLTYGEICYISSLRTNIFSIVQQEYSLDYSHIATLVLISGIVMQISTYITGIFSKRLGYNNSLIIGLFISGASIFSMIFVKSIALFNFLFILFMFGFGVCTLVLNMYAGLLAGDSRGKVLMNLHLGAALGMSVGPTVISQLVNIGFSWQFIMAMSSIPAFILIIILFISNSYNKKNNDFNNAVEKSISNKRFKYGSYIVWLYILMFICAQIWEYGVGTWFVIFARQTKNLTEIEAAKYLTIFLGSFPIGRIIYGKLLNYIDSYKSMLISFIGNFILILLSFLTKKLVFISLTGLLTCSMFPVMMSMMQEEFGDDSSDLIGFICMAGGILQYVFIWSVGEIGDLYGIKVGFGSLIIYMFIGALSILLIKKTKPAKISAG